MKRIGGPEIQTEKVIVGNVVDFGKSCGVVLLFETVLWKLCSWVGEEDLKNSGKPDKSAGVWGKTGFSAYWPHGFYGSRR